MNRAFALVLGALTCVVGIVPATANAQQTRLPWTSTFDRGDFSEWTAFRNSTGAAIVLSGCQAGSCVRAPLVAGTNNDNYGDFNFGDHFTVGGEKVEELWLQFFSKFDAGFIWPTKGQKMAIVNLTDGLTSTKHYQVFVYVRADGQYSVDHSYFTQWRFFGLPQNVGSPVSVVPGRWDKLKLYVRLNEPGHLNGIVRLWINDQLKVQYENVNIREATSYGMGKLNFGSYSNPPATSDGVQWWDSFTLSITDPDQSAVPMPPTNVQAE
jgi:hypothetical protein